MRSRTGFTVIESMLAVALLAASAVAVFSAVSTSRQQQAMAEQGTVAQTLAQQLMEEVVAKPFADPDGVNVLGPDAGESGRGQFDNLDDYHNYADSTANLKRVDETTVSSPAEKVYTRKVSVEYRLTVNGGPAALGDFALVTVSVSEAGVEVARLAQLVTSVAVKR